VVSQVRMGSLAFNVLHAHTLIVHAANQSIQWWRLCRWGAGSWIWLIAH